MLKFLDLDVYSGKMLSSNKCAEYFNFRVYLSSYFDMY